MSRNLFKSASFGSHKASKGSSMMKSSRGSSKATNIARSSRGVSTLAPASVSASLAPTIRYSSAVVGGRPALRISATVPICQIGNDSFNNGLLLQTATGAQTASVSSISAYSLPLAVQKTSSSTTNIVGEWVSPHVPLMAIAFDRYRMSSLMFCYEPQATATADERFVFAWTDDPNHPFLSALASGSDMLTPTQLEMLVTPDSVAFMPWKTWQLNVPVATDERFTFDQSAITGVNRFSEFGCFSCVGSNAPTTSVVYGVLYAKIVMDLFDPVPIVQNITGLVALLSSQRKGRRLVSPPLPPSEVPLAAVAESKEHFESKTSTDRYVLVASDEELPTLDAQIRTPKLVRSSGYVHVRSGPVTDSSSSSSTVSLTRK
jgi:hypothetical protein